MQDAVELHFRFKRKRALDFGWCVVEQFVDDVVGVPLFAAVRIFVVDVNRQARDALSDQACAGAEGLASHRCGRRYRRAADRLRDAEDRRKLLVVLERCRGVLGLQTEDGFDSFKHVPFRASCRMRERADLKS